MNPSTDVVIPAMTSLIERSFSVGWVDLPRCRRCDAARFIGSVSARPAQVDTARVGARGGGVHPKW